MSLVIFPQLADGPSLRRHARVGRTAAMPRRMTLVLALLLPLVTPFAAPAASASLRRDVWNDDLSESGCDDPKTGRRVHVVLDGVAKGMADANLSSVMINGQQGLNLDTSSSADLTHFDWLRAHTNGDTGGLWLSFHTRNLDWLGSTLEVRVEDKGGAVLYDGTVVPSAAESGLTLSYIAFRKNGTEAVLHVHNVDDESAHSLDGATLDGAALTLPSAAASVPASGHLILTTSLGSAKGVNAVWTASLLSGKRRIGFGGRVPSSERFVVEAWPHSTDCALPGGDDDNAAEAASLGIDSLYVGGSWSKSCGGTISSVIEKLAAGGGGARWWHVYAPLPASNGLSHAPAPASYLLDVPSRRAAA